MTATLTPFAATRPSPTVRSRSVVQRTPGPMIAALLAAVMAAIGWTRWGSHVAVGDIGHFVRDRVWHEGTSFFGYSLTGEGSPSYEIARVLELPFWFVGRLVGSPAVGQGLYYTVLAAAAAAAVAGLAGSFTSRRWVAVVVGLIGVVNPLTLTTFPNPNTLLATGVVAAFTAVLLRPRRGHDGLRLAACTLPAAYLAVNPPTVAILAVSAACGIVLAVARDPRRWSPLRRVGAALPWLLLLHLWWLVPQALVLGAGAAELADGLTSIDTWSWSHRNNSPGRILTLVAHWGWGEATYFPYAPSLDRPWWGWLAFALPVLAFAAPFVAPRQLRRPAIGMAVVAAAAAVAATGLHAPFTAVNRFLYDTVPGWWLFREPASKWGIVLLLAYLPAVAITVDAAAARVDTARSGGRWWARPLAAVTVLAAAAPLLFPWPLVTGAGMSMDRGAFPSGRSVVPAGWHDVAEHLNRDDRGGKVLLLPVPTFYQSTTDWGFHGVDNVPRQLLTRPLVTPQGDVYFAGGTDTFGELAHVAQAAILAGDAATAQRALQALGVTDVLLRRDLVSSTAHPLVVDANAIEAQLAAFAWATSDMERDVAAVFSVHAADPDTVSGRLATYAGVLDRAALAGGTAAAVATQPAEVASFAAADAVVPIGRPFVEGHLIDEEAGAVSLDGDAHVRELRSGPALYDAVVDGGTDVVMRARHRLSVAGDAAATERIPVPGRPVGLRVGGHHVPFGTGQVTFGASASAAVVVDYERDRRELDLARATFGDCDNVDGRPLDAVDITTWRLPDGVALRAGEHSACAVLALPPLRDGDVVTVGVDHVTGAPGRACVFDEDLDRCVADGVVRADGQLVIGDIPHGRDLALYLYADGQQQESHVRYTDLAVVTSASIAIDLPSAGTPANVAGGRLHVTGRRPIPVLTGPGPLADCHRVDDRSMAEAGLRAEVTTDGGVTLGAAAHAACVAWDVAHVVPGATHELALPVTAIEGRSPRYCVWADGPDRCVAEGVAAVPAGDHGVERASFVLPVDTTATRLYVYADGPEAGTTTVRYGVPELAVDPGVRWLATDHVPDEAPSVVTVAASPGTVRARLAAADQPFVLALADGDADGWRLDGLPADRVLGRGTVDGYAAGWMIAAGPAVEVTAVHGLDESVRRFHLAWLVLVAGVAAVAIGRELRLRRPRA